MVLFIMTSYKIVLPFESMDEMSAVYYAVHGGSVLPFESVRDKILKRDD